MFVAKRFPLSLVKRLMRPREPLSASCKTYEDQDSWSNTKEVKHPYYSRPSRDKSASQLTKLEQSAFVKKVKSTLLPNQIAEAHMKPYLAGTLPPYDKKIAHIRQFGKIQSI